MAEYRLKQYREAIPHLEKALAFKESRTAALEMMADSYQQLNMRPEALEVFRRIEAEGIAYPTAWFELGNEAAARGDDDMAIRYFSRFIAAVPDNPAAYFNLASSQYRKHDLTGSLSSAEQCVAVTQTPSVKATCLLLSADNLIAMGRRAEAFEHFERARALDPNNPRIKRD
jgi:tetratricopeptide (TPR) repeat protein